MQFEELTTSALVRPQVKKRPQFVTLVPIAIGRGVYYPGQIRFLVPRNDNKRPSRSHKIERIIIVQWVSGRSEEQDNGENWANKKEKDSSCLPMTKFFPLDLVQPRQG